MTYRDETSREYCHLKWIRTESGREVEGGGVGAPVE